jgi:hypothetical protein
LLIDRRRRARGRLHEVRKFRLGSKAARQEASLRPRGRFCRIAQPDSDNLPAPRVSSEGRAFVPIGFVRRNVIGNGQVLLVPGANPAHVAVLSSTMHDARVRHPCGRSKSDFRYSKGIVHNSLPWPECPTDAQKQKMEGAAQAVHDARAAYPNSSLADLCDPLTMPPNLVNARQALDAAVDAARGRKGFGNDAERVAFPSGLHHKRTSLRPAAAPAGKRPWRPGQAAV